MLMSDQSEGGFEMYGRQSRIVLVFGVAASLAMPIPPAEAQVEAIAGSIGTGVLVQQIGDQLNGLVENARKSGDFLAMRASQEALFVLEAFKRTSRDVLDDAFVKIGRERQALLNGLRQTVDDIEKGRIDTLVRLQQTGDQLDRLVRDTALKDHPTIYRYRGTIVTPGENTDVRVTIDGFRLTRREVSLTYRGKTYPAQLEGETVRFVLPRSVFTADDNTIKSDTAKLRVFYRSGAVLGMGGSWRPLEYDINFITLPTRLATVHLSYNAETKVRRDDSWDREESYRRSGHGGWKCKGFAFNPSRGGRLFDPDRTSVRRGSGNDNGKIEDIRIRDVGISFDICAKRPYSAGGPGYRHAMIHATEIWDDESIDSKSETVALTWTNNLAVPVAPKLNGLLIKVKDFTGAEQTVAAAGGKAGRYATITYDRDSNVVLVNPITPTDLGTL